MTALDNTTNIEAGAERQSDPFDSLWRFFSSTKVAIVLILLIAFVSFVGALIVQAPAGLTSDPVQYAQWLNFIRGKYGALTDVYNAIGLFNVYNVFWFRILIVILIFNTIICTINRLPTLWKSAFSPRVKVNESMFRGSPIKANIKFKQAQKGKSQPSGDAAANVFSTLSSKHYKVFTEQEGGVTHFYADRNGIFKLGTLVTHLSLVILMVGTVMGGMFGFTDDGAVIPEGKIYQVGFGENFLVRVDKFAAEFYDSGAPKDYYSDVTVIDGGKEVVKHRIHVNDPLEYKGVRFHQSFYGPAAVLDVKDSQGRPVMADTVPLDQGNGSSNMGLVNIPGSNVVLVATLPSSGVPNLPLTVQFYRGNTSLNRDTLQVGETKTIGDYQVTFKQPAQFTGLRIVKDPGVPVVWFACAMLVLGICITLYFPRRRIWGRVTGQELMIAGTADRTVNFRPEFDKLVEGIRGA